MWIIEGKFVITDINIFYSLIMSKVIHILQPITNSQMFGLMPDHYIENVLKEVREADKAETLDVFINSPGGSVNLGWDLFQAFRAHKGQVNMYVSGMAASMAGMLLLSADYVEATDTSEIMWHKPYFPGYNPEDYTPEMTRMIDKTTNDLIKIARSKNVSEEIIDLAFVQGSDVWMSAKKAEQAGIINKAVDIMADTVDRGRYSLAASSDYGITNQELYYKLEPIINLTSTKMSIFSKNKPFTGAVNLLNGEEKQTIVFENAKSANLEVGCTVKALGEHKDLEGVHDLEAGGKITIDNKGIVTALEAQAENEPEATATTEAGLMEAIGNLAALVNKVNENLTALTNDYNETKAALQNTDISGKKNGSFVPPTEFADITAQANDTNINFREFAKEVNAKRGIGLRNITATGGIDLVNNLNKK